MKSKTCIIILLIAFGLQEAHFALTKGKVKDKVCGAVDSVSVPLYRYHNSKSGDHFYTCNWNELGEGNDDYIYEGVQAYIFPNPETYTTPLHRYYNSHSVDHFYTTDWAELGGGQGPYVYEGITGYVYPNPMTGTIPMFRYFNGGNGDHFYTTNWTEIMGGSNGWNEGIAGFVCQ